MTAADPSRLTQRKQQPVRLARIMLSVASWQLTASSAPLARRWSFTNVLSALRSMSCKKGRAHFRRCSEERTSGAAVPASSRYTHTEACLPTAQPLLKHTLKCRTSSWRSSVNTRPARPAEAGTQHAGFRAKGHTLCGGLHPGSWYVCGGQNPLLCPVGVARWLPLLGPPARAVRPARCTYVFTYTGAS